jgi:hypothetical protein
MYPLAQDLLLEPSQYPGIEVRGAGRCDSPSGQFYVRDLQYAKDGSVSSFAADVVQYCPDEDLNTPTLYGWVRYNSTVPLQMPIAVVGPAQATFSGFPVALDGSQSVAGPGTTVTSYQWNQIVTSGDPTVILTGANTTNPSFVAPAVPAGGKDLTFKLSVTGSTGLTASSTVTVHVGSQNDPKSLLLYASDPTDPVGGGKSGLVLDSLNGYVEGELFPYDTSLEVVGLDPTVFGDWTLSFYAGNGPGLAPGIYMSDGVSPFSSMLVKSGATCNSPTGIFIVRDVRHAANGRLDGIGVDFLQRCAGVAGVLRGAIRLNSITPTQINQPTAIAGFNQTLTSPGLVTLDGSLSFVGWSGNASYRWTQLTGPKVQLMHDNSPVAIFAMPAIAFAGQGATLVFQLEVRNAAGSSVSHVAVRAQGTSSLSLQSDMGDPIGLGQTASYTLQPDDIKLQEMPDNSLKLMVASGGGWQLDFAAKNKLPLKAGTYSGATFLKMTARPTPQMSVSVGSRQCSALSGDFTVLDLQRSQNGKVTSLAVDFDQTCTGASGVLHGKLRYDSIVP